MGLTVEMPEGLGHEVDTGVEKWGVSEQVGAGARCLPLLVGGAGVCGGPLVVQGGIEDGCGFSCCVGFWTSSGWSRWGLFLIKAVSTEVGSESYF